MNTSLTSAQLKSISRGQLLGKYGNAISVEVLAASITGVALVLCLWISDPSTLAGLVITWLIALLISILAGIFQVGLTRFYLNLVCNRPYRTNDIFCGFSSHADRAIAVRFLLLLMQLLCMTPFYICRYFYLNQSKTAVMFLVCCLTAVAGMAVRIFFSLRFAQVYYVMLDFPNYTVRQIFSTSCKIMKGHKGRLFYICVTLIPYYLSSFLSCGIAFLWVIPFMRTLLTNFYLDIMHREYTV